MPARTSVFTFLALGLALSFGCGDDEGSRPAADGGSDGGHDSGLSWMLDAGDEKPDTGTDPGVRACEQIQPLPDVVLPLCTAATQDCVLACKDEDCRSACFAQDKHEAVSGLTCQSCVILQLFACADQQGCHETTADMFCCIDDKCGTGSADGCADAMCGSEIDANLACIGAKPSATACLSYDTGLIAKCFETSDEDAGTSDAGE